MTAVSTVGTKVRVATAACAIVAAATVAPAAIAYASPAAPLPAAALGSTLSGGTLTPCDPALSACTSVGPAALAPGGSSQAALALPQQPFVWLGPANPAFQPLFGIVFPNFFGLNFEACLLGAAVHLSPYGTGFIGLGLGC
jgi:hypothetical protein